MYSHYVPWFYYTVQVVAFAGSTETAVNTLDREFQELKK